MKKIFLLTFAIVFVANIAGQDPLPIDKWTYIQLDSTRAKWGDFDEPEWLRYFGLDMQDINLDGYRDIVSGRYVYLNPGGNMEGKWQRVDLGMNVDGMLFVNVDDDNYADIIATALPDVYWLEADNVQGTAWKAMKIGQIPKTGHVNGQGYKMEDIISGGKPEILLTAHDGIYMAEIPGQPLPGNWDFKRIVKTSSDEGFDASDIDGDGDLDIVAGDLDENDEPRELYWYVNPGKSQPDWERNMIGETMHAIDRLRVEDINQDGEPDIVISEERFPGKEPDANLYYFQGATNSQYPAWKSKVIITQYSMNNLDVADVDKDGYPDIVTNEHKGDKHQTQLFIYEGQASFKEVLVDTGKECHLGTRLVDLDNDGDLDIVGHAWDNYEFLHLWRNDAIVENHKWKKVSSAQGDLPVPTSGNQQTALLVEDINQDNLPDIIVAERTKSPALTCLYNEGGLSFTKTVIEQGPLPIEAGSAYADIDDDGDIDILFGGDSQSKQVWWWENPHPEKKDWKRHLIKNSGATKHHDILAGDFDGDGKTEVVFWNQGKEASALFLAEIPGNPRQHQGEWPLKKIYDYSPDSEMQPVVGLHGYPGYPMVNEHEGLAAADIDMDGLRDIVGGGHWFKYEDGRFMPNVIDASYQFSRTVVGQLMEGGRPEVVLALGDGDGPLYMYYWHEWEGWKGIERGTGTWARVLVDEHVHFGHSIDIVDFDMDGVNDIFLAEMSFEGELSRSGIFLYKGMGHGKFKKMIVDTGIGAHESKMKDMDGDGDLDIINKPYTWNAPRLDIYVNPYKD